MIITSYINPDLDGLACMVAYRDFLSYQKVDAVVAISGRPQKEAEFVFNELNLPWPEYFDKVFINNNEKIILVDVANKLVLDKKIDPNNVVEIIDHHATAQISDFPNAKIQLEIVGAAATLVAEKFKKHKINISKDVATLLYLGIISNTANLQSKNTTKRDIKISRWLKKKIDLSDDFVTKMFKSKSTFTESLDKVLLQDLKIVKAGGVVCSVAQLEIFGVDTFLDKNYKDFVPTLKKIKQSKKSDCCFMVLADIEKGFSFIMTADNYSQALLEKALGSRFKDLSCVFDHLILRKEILKKLDSLN